MNSPRPASPDAQASAAHLCEQARVYLAQGDPSSATDCCREALSLNHDCLDAHTLLAGVTLGGEYYLELLGRIHKHLRPRTYLEIGVANGDSMALAGKGTLAIGIDPHPTVVRALRPSVRVLRETSDEFFAQRDLRAEFSGRPLDLAFIDGMHQFEYTLRDFIHVERNSAVATTVLIHDCYPLDEPTAARDRVTTFWTGDVWKIVVCLKKYRPDLQVHTLAAPPTGLCLVRGLDRKSRVLSERVDAIREEFMALPFSAIESGRPEKLNLVPGDWNTARRLLA